MRSTTRGSLSFCAWRRTSSSLEMVALFPFANVGRILPIIAHFSEYVELFMRTYIVRAETAAEIPSGGGEDNVQIERNAEAEVVCAALLALHELDENVYARNCTSTLR